MEITLKRTSDFAIYVTVGAVVIAFVYWLSETGFDLDAHPVGPYVGLISVLAFATQIEIRRTMKQSFSVRFWIWLCALVLLAILPVWILVSAVQPWAGAYSVGLRIVEALLFVIVLDRVAPGRNRVRRRH